ncbi:MAG: DUF6775 family putative metallopeptidase [Candidatus Ratteibacteria bacterium]
MKCKEVIKFNEYYLIIYNTYHYPDFDLDKIISFIKKNFLSFRILKREDFFVSSIDQSKIKNIAERFSKIRVKDRKRKIKEDEVIYPVEIEYEEKRLKGEIKKHGVIYDGFEFQDICKGLIKRKEMKINFVNIILTNQLIATFDENDKSYHLRVIILGQPNIISTTGIIEALAKPKEYYFKLQIGYDRFNLKKEFGDKIIDYEDRRITDILKVYFSQAIFYNIFGEVFCDDKKCKLYNFHWQQEIISHLESGTDFCEKHFNLIKKCF